MKYYFCVMFKREFVITEDGSHTLFNEEVGECYHSSFGAIQESEHIFMVAGLKELLSQPSLNILEVGTGTGLNVLLTYLKTSNLNMVVNYDGIELYPIDKEIVERLNYCQILKVDNKLLSKIHSGKNKSIHLGQSFTFKNTICNIIEMELEKDKYNLVYFDAFSPDAQPDIWTEELFVKIYFSMKNGGILTTYSCKGIVKRALKSAGFIIEKLPGPPGKREFLRAVKV